MKGPTQWAWSCLHTVHSGVYCSVDTFCIIKIIYLKYPKNVSVVLTVRYEPAFNFGRSGDVEIIY